MNDLLSLLKGKSSAPRSRRRLHARTRACCAPAGRVLVVSSLSPRPSLRPPARRLHGERTGGTGPRDAASSARCAAVLGGTRPQAAHAGSPALLEASPPSPGGLPSRGRNRCLPRRAVPGCAPCQACTEPRAGWSILARHGAPCRAGWLAARLHAALGMESSKKPHWSVLVTIRATCDKRGDAAGAGTTSAEGDHARGLAGCGACEGRGVRRGACASSAGRVACAGRGGPDGRGGRGYRARGDRRTCGREPRGRGGAAVLRGGASTAGPNPGSLPHCLQ